MKKYSFLAYYKDYDAFLHNIRELGVVHIAEKKQGVPENAELQECIRLSSRLNSVIKLLKKSQVVSISHEGDQEKGWQVLKEIETIQEEKTRLNQQIQAYSKDCDVLEPWGNFDLSGIKNLENEGFKIGFYICPEQHFNQEWFTQYNATEINRIGSKIFFITISRQGEFPELEIESIKLPANSLNTLNEKRRKAEEELKELDDRLYQITEKDMSSLEEALRGIYSKIEFSKVVLNTEQTVGDQLMLLQGWAPASQEKAITEYLNKQEVYYEVTNPTIDDNVPIQLNNKGFFRLFEPICKLYMLPKYNELDLTPFFAPFFMIFFGLCLGDSGYGLFMVLGVCVYRIWAKQITPSMKSILTLVQILGISTFFCGMLTGIFFGFHLYETDIFFFRKMKDFLFLDNQWMFNLSLILGAIQIVFGMMLKAYNRSIQFGFKYALSTIGWIILLVSFAVAYLLPAVLPMVGTVHLIILAVVTVLVFFFNSPGKNILMNIGLGFWDSYNMVTGLLGDILSYVRLFALGLSGGILASVFNSLAAGMSPDHVIFGPMVMVLIFLIGHSINMFMNILGAMVHPMRLTFVEFFKNSGYQGGGKEYKPFKN